MATYNETVRKDIADKMRADIFYIKTFFDKVRVPLYPERFGYSTECPFDKEKKARLYQLRPKFFWRVKCSRSSSRGMDIFDLLTEYYSINFPQAYQMLKDWKDPEAKEVITESSL